MPQRIPRLVALMLAALFMVGCAVRPGDPPTTIERLLPFLRVATIFGVDHVLTKNPTYAAPVVAVTNGLLALFSTNATVTMAQLHATIRATLATMPLDPDVRLVLEALFESVVNELRAVIIYHGVADDNVTLYVHTVVTWVKDAAMLHLPAPALPPRVTK